MEWLFYFHQALLHFNVNMLPQKEKKLYIRISFK